jgi:hypothetical protein
MNTAQFSRSELVPTGGTNQTGDLETVIQDLLSGQYTDPIRVIGLNTAESWSADVSEDVAQELRGRSDLQTRRAVQPSKASHSKTSCSLARRRFGCTGLVVPAVSRTGRSTRVRAKAWLPVHLRMILFACHSGRPGTARTAGTAPAGSSRTPAALCECERIAAEHEGQDQRENFHGVLLFKKPIFAGRLCSWRFIGAWCSRRSPKSSIPFEHLPASIGCPVWTAKNSSPAY